MKNKKLRVLGGATLITALASSFVVSGAHLAFADEAASTGSTGQGEVAIFDGPALLPPTDRALPSEPPREGAPGPTPPREEPVPPQEEPAIPNPTTEPNSAPTDPPRESKNPTPVTSGSNQAADPVVSSIQTSSPAEEAAAAPKDDAGSGTKPPVTVLAEMQKPALIPAPAMAFTLQLPAGSKVLNGAAKATLTKTVDAVKKSNKPASISIKTEGTTITKATAQANLIVTELKKRGVSAVTVIKRVGTKTVVSVLVTKKKP